MSNSVKVALLVCSTAILLALIASITSVQITGGDTATLIRNFGLVAVFLVTNVPILVSQMRNKEQTGKIAQTTQNIEKKVNGELQALVSQSVQDGVSSGIGTAVQQLSSPVNNPDSVIEGQGNRSDDVQSS